MDKFLKAYYKQLHFNSMSPEVRARFFEWVKNDTLTDDMRIWVRDYLQHQPAPNQNQLVRDGNGNPVPKATLNPALTADLTDDTAKELFLAFQQAFVGMASDLNSFKDKDPQSEYFVRKYFGQNKLFNISPATRDCEAGIREIVNLLNTHDLILQNNLRNYVLNNTKKDDGKPVFENLGKLQAFLDDCSARKYNTDNSFQKKIQTVARTLGNAVGWYSSIDHDTPEYAAIKEIESHINNVVADDAFAMNAKDITPIKLRDFRSALTANKENYGLLQTLYFNKTIRDKFGEYDKGVITGPINGAEKAINYEKITPKIDDVLTPWQQLQKWASDTYDDAFKKYEELRGNHNFFKQEAKDIFKAVDKAKVKPTDGIKGILDKQSDIKKSLNNPVAQEHFDWFVQTVGPLANQMPKAFEGAWKDAKQMQAIASQIILKATDPKNSDPHAMEKAKTAMEIMTAMKYGMTTSKIMTAIKEDKELFTFFSHKDLSWNKNEGVKFVTGALDKTVRIAFLGIGYGITIVKNKIKLSGRKFKDKDNQQGALAERYNLENENGQQALRDQNALDRNTLNDRQQEIQNLNQGPNAVNSGNLNAQTRRLPGLQQNLRQAQAETQARQTDFNTISTQTQDARERLKTEAQYSQRHDALVQEINTINAEMTKLQNEISALSNTPIDDARKQMLTAQLTEQIKAHDEKNKELTDLDNTHNAYIGPKGQQAQDQQAENQYNNAQTALNNAQTAEKTARQEYDELNDRIQQFQEATQEIAELTTAITQRENALNNWPEQNTNKVIELENYWNFLQDNTTTWGFSQKRDQKRFDKNKQSMLQNYITKRGMGA